MSDATESTPLSGYGVRACRGHWHVVTYPSGEDLAVKGDPFASREEALEAAERESRDFPVEPAPAAASSPAPDERFVRNDEPACGDPSCMTCSGTRSSCETCRGRKTIWSGNGWLPCPDCASPTTRTGTIPASEATSVTQGNITSGTSFHSSPTTREEPRTEILDIEDLISLYGVASFDYGQSKINGRETEMKRCLNERAIRRTAVSHAIASLRESNSTLQRELDKANAFATERGLDNYGLTNRLEDAQAEVERLTRVVEAARAVIAFYDKRGAASDTSLASRLESLRNALAALPIINSQENKMEMERGEFHQVDGWYFRRLEDGSVRIRKDDTVHVIPPNEWASIVAHVSGRPHAADAFHAANNLHGGAAMVKGFASPTGE